MRRAVLQPQATEHCSGSKSGLHDSTTSSTGAKIRSGGGGRAAYLDAGLLCCCSHGGWIVTGKQRDADG